MLPQLLLCVGYWLARLGESRLSLRQAQIVASLASLGLVASASEMVALNYTTRSNVREIARTVRSTMRDDDLLVVAPEWFAASFDHYFPPSIEQVNYPFSGRSMMIDFSNVWESRQKSTATTQLDSRLASARRDRRRVWYVVEKRYIKLYSQDFLETAYRHRQPVFYSVRDARHILESLRKLYGPPQFTYNPREGTPIHDDLLAFLFIPPVDSRIQP